MATMLQNSVNCDESLQAEGAVSQSIVGVIWMPPMKPINPPEQIALERELSAWDAASEEAWDSIDDDPAE